MFAHMTSKVFKDKEPQSGVFRSECVLPMAGKKRKMKILMRKREAHNRAMI